MVADLKDPAGSHPQTPGVTETAERLYLQNAPACTGLEAALSRTPGQAQTTGLSNPRITMKLALDLHLGRDTGAAAGVAFDDWAAAEPTRTCISLIAHVEKAQPGDAGQRELTCLLQLLREQGLAPEVILINGWVHTDAMETAGLGRHLYQALGGRVAIIGVARTALPGTPAQFEVYREEEARPLIVTCVGIELGAAKARLRAMHGKRRVPTLLKLATRLAKAGLN